MRSPAGLRGFFLSLCDTPAASEQMPLAECMVVRNSIGCTACLILLALFGGAPAIAADGPGSAIAPFSAGSPGAAPPAPWRISALRGVKRATQYSLVTDDATVVLRAVANASMASVMHPLRADPKDTPFLSWRWKVSNILRKSDINSKSGDDFPARVYVLFDYDVGKLSIVQRAKIYMARSRYGKDVPAAALCYVWDGKAPVGTSVWSPYTDRVRVIVVESGSANLNRWRDVQRDVVADFRAAFGEDPPAISGVAVASDTDNTGESVTALFGDIRLTAQSRDAR
jgi:hypothetical protein